MPCHKDNLEVDFGDSNSSNGHATMFVDLKYIGKHIEILLKSMVQMYYALLFALGDFFFFGFRGFLITLSFHEL